MQKVPVREPEPRFHSAVADPGLLLTRLPRAIPPLHVAATGALRGLKRLWLPCGSGWDATSLSDSCRPSRS